MPPAPPTHISVERPQLDLPPWEDELARLRSRAALKLRGGQYAGIDKLIKGARAFLARPAAAMRVRRLPDAGDTAAEIHRKAGPGRKVMFRTGLVEIVNMDVSEPCGMLGDFDYRVRLRWSDDTPEAVLEPEAVCVIARQGGPAATPGNIRRIPLTHVVKEGARALALVDDGSLRPADLEDVSVMLQPPRAEGPVSDRVSSDVAAAQVNAVPDALQAWEAAGRPDSMYSFVAAALARASGHACSPQQARERIRRARKLGHAPPGRAGRPAR
ncbi:hypothetical protein [Dermatobacter hominis]|uniref:hypothetical protein n=1 Tax=Dermatobacter hominis TaxID=2884263 RepID=UPI001D0F913D|nr:hypothetical protein [Dermatobacter hominis]UDY35686.1 hypothetical protein LH044_20465 [Dermatobacter hominis]